MEKCKCDEDKPLSMNELLTEYIEISQKQISCLQERIKRLEKMRRYNG